MPYAPIGHHYHSSSSNHPPPHRQLERENHLGKSKQQAMFSCIKLYYIICNPIDCVL